MITTISAPEIEQTVRMLADLFSHAMPEKVSFKLWDGTMWPDHEPRAATIVLKGRANLSDLAPLPGCVCARFRTRPARGLSDTALQTKQTWPVASAAYAS